MLSCCFLPAVLRSQSALEDNAILTGSIDNYNSFANEFDTFIPSILPKRTQKYIIPVVLSANSVNHALTTMP